MKHAACLLLLPLLVSAVTYPTPAQQRSFPDTRDGIFVFADQIPPGNTDAQNRFAATHYLGTQKMIRDDIEAIRVYNPDFLHLHYKLSVGQGDSTILFIDGNDWVTDWDYVNQQDDWFVTDGEGTRIRHVPDGWYLMDVSGQISGAGEDGWKEYWASTCIEQMRHNAADGVFADSYDIAVVNADFLDPPYFWFEGTNPLTYWVPHLEIFGNYITEQLHAQPERFYVLPNLGFQVTSWDTTDYAFADGGMIEGFAQWGGDNPFSLSDWKLQMNRILALVALDKILICQSYMWDAWDMDDRGFYLGCYLLVKGHHTYVNILSGGPGQNMQYYPEYDVDLGPYLDEPPLDVDSLYVPELDLYRRDYEKGFVLVNPTWETRDVALGDTLYLVVPQGGGVVDGNAQYGGSLAFQPATQVTLGEHEGLILLYDLPVPEEQATGLSAFHRSGQTFLTWTETSAEGETYNVYRSHEPITEANLSQAERIAQVPEGSAFYANEWMKEEDYDPSTHAVQRNFIIEDMGPELPDGTGLLVWTPHEETEAYYAVTVVVDGIENTQIGAENSLQTPVAETDDPPMPVMVWASETGRGWVFTQFMDYAALNPTFDGYAYNYSVSVPTNYDGSVPFPVTLALGGWGTRYIVYDSAPYDYQTIYVSVDDAFKTWFYGYSATHDFAQGTPPTSGPVGNFTEWRLLRCVDELIRHDLYNVDEERIYAFGGSMGGSGALALGMRYPDVFAAVYAALPMTNYATAGDSGGVHWADDVIPKWGTLEDDFPVANLGPRAGHLTPYDGTGVWEWMNHQANMLSRVGDEMAYIATAHGKADAIIEWPTQGAPWYEIMQQDARRGFAGKAIPDWDHTWTSFAGQGPMLPFESFVFRKDRSFPGFTNCSLNDDVRYNLDIEWSCPWNDFAGDIVDAVDRYEIVLRIRPDGDLPDTATVDVTPRRLQAFTVTPGATYAWSNLQLPEEEAIQGGLVTADDDGLLLVGGFLVTKAGNRLVLEPEAGAEVPEAHFTGPPALEAPRPNPFVEALTIAYRLREPGTVRVRILDAQGRRVRILEEGRAAAGRHTVVWDGRDARGRRAAAGVYWVEVRGPGLAATRSVIRLR
jgi:hypothetical protein